MKKLLKVLSFLMMIMMIIPFQSLVGKMEGSVDSENAIVINEINSSPDDWVELINIGSKPVNLMNFEIRDNSDDHRWKFSEEIVLNTGEIIVVDAKTSGLVYDQKAQNYVKDSFESAIGIGSGDSIRLYDQNGQKIDEYSWTSHASYKGDAAKASFGRFPDGTGEFCLTEETKGTKNIKLAPQIVINEVQSNDKDGGPDWIELGNPTDFDIDISGLVIKDEKDKNPYTVPENTVISANGYLVIKKDDNGVNGFKFGLGKGDSVRLFYNEEKIAETTWPADTHTNPTWGLYPDLTGTEYKNTLEQTPGEANTFKEVASNIPTEKWDGRQDIEVFDDKSTFLEDSSGLDFANGKLYAVDNGTATFWIMNLSKDGNLTFAKGFENGKKVCFKKDAENLEAKGPDAEGITVDKNGMVYIASERDNEQKSVNLNKILMVNPETNSTRIVAEKEWDLTNSLPNVSANMGIEAVEWVDNSEVEGLIVDQNTGKLFSASAYPKAVAQGVFFVALEDNGHVYAYVLNEDETSVQIADIDTQLGGAMALDYNESTSTLWVGADNGYGNKMAKIKFNKTEKPEIIHVLPPDKLDKNANNEGFAIASDEYISNNLVPVFRFCDGVKTGALTIGYLTNNNPKKPTENSEKLNFDKSKIEIEEGKAKDIILTIDIDYSNFDEQKIKVCIDDKLLKKDEDYTVRAGSIVLTLKAKMLNKLKAGNHIVKVETESGSATVNIEVVKSENSQKDIIKKSGSNPKTGVNQHLLMLSFIAFSSSVPLFYFAKRKNRN
ncbi:MAG: lamin tail domain-containing protein [Clostridia bacterium]|nr:lamin tail domain-containing protein [Clostridia bacterium]